MKVRLTREARNDLREIRAFYLRDYPATAERIRRSILAAVELLAAHPQIGLRNRRTPEIQSKLVTRYPYRIHYRVRGEVLVVIHIRHTARRPWQDEAE